VRRPMKEAFVPSEIAQEEGAKRAPRSGGVKWRCRRTR